MLTVHVTGPRSERAIYEFDQAELTVGCVQGNDLILHDGGVDRRHARIVVKDGQVIIVDLKSATGTRVNTRRLTAPAAIHDYDEVQIGGFIMRVRLSDRPAEAQR